MAWWSWFQMLTSSGLRLHLVGFPASVSMLTSSLYHLLYNSTTTVGASVVYFHELSDPLCTWKSYVMGTLSAKYHSVIFLKVNNQSQHVVLFRQTGTPRLYAAIIFLTMKKTRTNLSVFYWRWTWNRAQQSLQQRKLHQIRNNHDARSFYFRVSTINLTVNRSYIHDLISTSEYIT